MPRNRPSLFPLMAPAIAFITLAGILLLLMVSAWNAADAREAASTRAKSVALAAARAIDDAVERQRIGTDLLARSPMVWLWVKFQGARLSASNRSHADTAWKEISNYGRLIPGAALVLGSERTRMLYREGAPVSGLARDDARAAWYFAALAADGVLVSADGAELRTSARILDGPSLLGVVSCVTDGAALATAVLTGVAEPGMRVALLGAGGAEAATDASPALAATVIPGWVVSVSPPSAIPLAAARLLVLAGVPAATLLLVLLVLAVIALRRIRATTAALDRCDEDRRGASAGFAEVAAAAAGASVAAARLADLAEQMAKETAAAAQSSAEAARHGSRAEAREEGLRAAVAARGALLERLAKESGAAMASARGAEAGAQALAASAAKAEEELSRVITSAAAAAGAAQKAARGGKEIVEGSEKMRLLSMNAALEAARGAGQGVSRIAEEMRGLAEDAAARSRSLDTALGEAAESVKAASMAAQNAGRAAHEASGAAAGLGVGGGWDGVAQALAEAAGLPGDDAGSAAGMAEAAARADQARSALEGMGRIVGRMSALAAEMTGLAGQATADAARSARAAEAGKNR